MKLPKIVLKKNAMRARKAEQLGALERQPGKTDTPSPLSKSSQRQQQQQPRAPLPSSSHSPRANTAHTTTTNGRMSSSSAHSPRARHPASPRAALSRCSTSSSMLDNDSAASSEYGRDESFSTSTGGSSHSDNRSSVSSGSSASSQASSRRSFSQSMSEAQLGKAPTTEVASKPPRTQYSAYARKMKTAKRQRGMLPRTNSAVDFDDADEFFDKSDSSLGGGNSPSFTPATDTARGGRGRRQHSKYAGDAYDEDLRDEESEEEEERDEVRQPYRSGIPTGRRMTQKEILQRRLLREKEEAVLAARQAKAERHTSRPATSSPRKGQTMVGDADGANTVTSRLARAATMNAPALTATSSTAPMPSSSEGRSSTNKGNNNNSNNASDKKPMGLLGWRRKLLPTALKNSRSVTPSSKEDASSPSNSRSGMTISGSRTSLSASSPTASQRHGGASAVVAAAVETQSPRGDRASGRNTRRGSAPSSPAGSPKAAGKPTTTTVTATARGKSTLSATAVTAPAVAPNAGAATASASATASPPLDVHQPISKETLRRLNNQQLSRLDFNAQKARKMSRSERNAAEASGLLGAGSNPSLLSNGGYGSFLDGLPFTEEDDGDDTRSNGSRRSNNSRSSNHHHRHRHEAQQQQQQQQQQHGAASAAAAAASARPKPPTRTSSFFRGFFRSSSGASKENYTPIDNTPSATPFTEKRTRPTTADVGTLKREKALAEPARSSESPSSEVSGAGATSLYNMESDLSSTVSSTNSTQNNNNGCSSGTLTYRGEQILKRKRGNLPGAHGRNGRLLSGGGGSDDLARSHTDHELNDSFGSLFKADGHAVALYGSRTTTPSEFGSAPTPSGGALEVAMAAIAKRSVVGGEASALPSPQSHTSQPASLFPHNSYPRAMAAAALPAPAGNNHAAAPSFNAFGAVWLPQQQNLLGKLEAPALGATTNTNGAVAMRLATPVALAGQSPTPPMPPAVAAAAAAATLPTGPTASPGTEGMAGTPSAEAEEMRRDVPDKRAESITTISPTPAFDDFAAAGVVGGAAPCKSVSPPRSLDGEGRSRGGHRRRHRSRRSDHADGSAVTSDTNASRASRQDVQRKSSQLSVTEGFRVRGRGNGSGETSKDGADDGTLRAKTTSGGSRTEKGATAHPPPGAPSSSDPRRSENGRHGGSAAAAATTDNSLFEGNPENSRSATITMKPARHNSASLPPQPPTLSNTETRNYRGRFAASGSGGASSSSAAAAAAAGTSLSAAIAPLQGSDVALPTRADSKDFLLRHDHDTRPAAASATTTAAPRLSHHESSSRRHRTQRSSNASSRHDSSFSFSSESLLDGKARGRLAKAAAASNAASNSVERRRGGSNTTNGEGEGNMTSKRQHARDQNSTSLRASQHFRKSDLSPHQLHNTNGHAKANVNADGDEDRHHHHRHHRGSGTRRSSDVEMCESSGSQRRRRSRGDLYGSSRRPSSASVSLVAGLDEVLPHRPMHLRNASTSTTGSLSAAPSSRNSSASSGERRDDAVGRNSVRYLKKMAAKARDVSASSSCDLDARAASTTSNKSDSAFHAHSKAMAQMSDQNTSKIAAAGSSSQLTRMQQSTGSAAVRHHHGSAAPRSGSATRITSNANAAAYAMKLPSFKPNAMVESSSSNDVSTDRPANSGGSRQHASSNHHHHHNHGGDAAAVQLQRMPLTMSHEGGAGPHKGSGNYLLQPTRPVGTSGNGRLSYANNATSIGNTNNNADGTEGNGVGGYPIGTEKDAGVVGGNLKRVQSNANSGSSGGDRVTSSAEGRKSWGNAMAGSTGGKGGVTLPPAMGQYSLSSAVGVESNSETLGATTPFIGEGGVRSSVPTALLAQPRDSSAKRRRPTTENFTPWSVDMSRFTKLQQEETTEPPSA